MYNIYKGVVMGKWIIRMIEATVVTVTLAAVCQELEKPKEERHWHDKLGFIPYDFRLPTIERIKEFCWNPYKNRIFTSTVFGIGWTINFYTLLERMRIIGEIYVTEDDFLMPTRSMRKILENRPVIS
jgi:hypothetical protein